MKRIVVSILFGVFMILGIFYCDAMAMQMSQSFDEIVQKADVIFLVKAVDQQSRLGTSKKEMIFTDVSFEVERLIHSKQNPLKKGDIVQLTFAGGELGGRIIQVTDVPSFELGESYIIFTLMDGQTYASPIIGAFQGLFHVKTDEVSGISHPLIYGKRAIVRIDDEDHLVAGPKVKKIHSGVIEEELVSETATYYDVAPQPVVDTAISNSTTVIPRSGTNPIGTAKKESPKATVSRPAKEKPEKIMNVEEFIAEIQKRIKK
jgi:hypothetical protein